jgi:hypothetical protein
VEETLDKTGAASEGQPVPEAVEQWLGLLDMAASAHLIRNYINEHGAEDFALRALIRFLVSKKSHSQDDRDKVDWLATYLFKKREEEKRRPTTWPKADVQEVLEGFEFPMLSRSAESLLMEMPALLDEVKFFERFSQITDSRIIERARGLKNQFGEEFFCPDVLAAVVNYNLLFGQRFNRLIEETMRQVHDFARSGHHAAPLNASEIMKSDYRLSTETLRQLGETGRKEAPEQELRAGGEAGAAVPPEQQLKQLGVEVEQENLYLKSRNEELTMRLRANPTMNSVPNSFAPLMLADWEASAFRTPLPDAEQSYRADFARGICRAITIIYRIYEEIPQYLEKKGTEYLWKRHYDSLVFLLYEGRRHKEALQQLAAASEKRGLLEKAKQLQGTSQKLDTGLAKVAELF